MADIHGKITTSQGIGGKVGTKSAVNGDLDKDVKDRLYRDYNLLHNKPSIEGVELKGNKTLEDLGIERFLYDTTENWNAQVSLLSQQGTCYVYVDGDQDDQGNYIPRLKLGDGRAYLIDMPYLDGKYYEHVRDNVIHVSQADRDRWDNKVRVYVGDLDNENLIFTTN